MQIPHSAHVLVVDGSRMLILRNKGHEAKPDLEVITEDVMKNPASREMMSDGPGRGHESMSPNSHAYEATDIHQRREDDFGRDALAQLCKLAGPKDRLVLIAPPRMLGVLRKLFDKDVESRMVAEINKDLSHLKPTEIAAYVLEH